MATLWSIVLLVLLQHSMQAQGCMTGCVCRRSYKSVDCREITHFNNNKFYSWFIAYTEYLKISDSELDSPINLNPWRNLKVVTLDNNKNMPCPMVKKATIITGHCIKPAVTSHPQLTSTAVSTRSELDYSTTVSASPELDYSTELTTSSKLTSTTRGSFWTKSTPVVSANPKFVHSTVSSKSKFDYSTKQTTTIKKGLWTLTGSDNPRTSTISYSSTTTSTMSYSTTNVATTEAYDYSSTTIAPKDVATTEPYDYDYDVQGSTDLTKSSVEYYLKFVGIPILSLVLLVVGIALTYWIIKKRTQNLQNRAGNNIPLQNLNNNRDQEQARAENEAAKKEATPEKQEPPIENVGSVSQELPVDIEGAIAHVHTKPKETFLRKPTLVSTPRSHTRSFSSSSSSTGPFQATNVTSIDISDIETMEPEDEEVTVPKSAVLSKSPTSNETVGAIKTPSVDETDGLDRTPTMEGTPSTLDEFKTPTKDEAAEQTYDQTRDTSTRGLLKK